jgi:hypothetical protein
MTVDRQMLPIQEIFDRDLDLFQLDKLPIDEQNTNNP